MTPASPYSIVLFDGECGLCHASVDFILRRKHRARFGFAALHSNAALEVLDGRDLPEVDSVILIDDEGVHIESDASLRILRRLGGAWSFLGDALLLLPSSARDGVYRLIAKNRRRWFPQRRECRVPTEAERSLFLPIEIKTNERLLE